jgi:hypothetical protein
MAPKLLAMKEKKKQDKGRTTHLQKHFGHIYPKIKSSTKILEKTKR